MVRRARALHAWDEAAGAAGDDLHFTAGQEFELVSESIPGGGWYTGNIDGTEGIFPGNFVDVIEVPESSSPPAAADVQARARRAAPPIATEALPAATAESANTDARAEKAAAGGVSEESEPPPGAANAAAPVEAAALWDGKNDQQRAADEARARRAAKKNSGSALELELEEEEEEEDEEPVNVPMTPAERRAEWKLTRQRTAEKAEAVAPANPMLKSVDSENGPGDNPEDAAPAQSLSEKREEWKQNRQASAVQAEELAPGSASPPQTRRKPERPTRNINSDSLSLADSEDRSDQGADSPIGTGGAHVHAASF